MTSDTAAHEATWLGHPRGLFYLFFTEMWERFSYYGMRALLVLYIYSSATKGGLGWEKAEALALYGWYTMMVYVASIPGGIIADRLWGRKKCVIVGGLTLCVGHGTMAIPEQWAFFTALTLIVMGVGLLKPNISTLVGELYREGDPRRDKGFTIFYMGINTGALMAGLIVGFVGQEYGWHYGFGLAGIGMLLGQIVFMSGQKHLAHVGTLQASAQAAVAGGAGSALTKVERDRIKVMLLSFVVVMVFWGAFEQAGGLMSIYTDEKVDRSLFGVEIYASVFQSLNPGFIIIFGTLVAGFWYGRLRAGKESSALFKMAVGTMIMGSGFIFMVLAANEGSEAEAVGQRAKQVVEASIDVAEERDQAFAEMRAVRVAAEADAKAAGEALPEESRPTEDDISKVGEEAIQSLVDAEYARIVAATRDLPLPEAVPADEAGNTVEFAADVEKAIRGGLMETTESDEELNAASAAGNSYKVGVRASTGMLWLLLAYLFHTIGELCASPVALSFITKLSPAKYAAIMMGIYFAVTGFGNKLAGYVGGQVEHYSEYTIFTGITIFTMAFGFLLLVFLKPLKAMTHGAEDEDGDA